MQTMQDPAHPGESLRDVMRSTIGCSRRYATPSGETSSR